jgi:hypothetical protein
MKDRCTALCQRYGATGGVNEIVTLSRSKMVAVQGSHRVPSSLILDTCLKNKQW